MSVSYRADRSVINKPPVRHGFIKSRQGSDLVMQSRCPVYMACGLCGVNRAYGSKCGDVNYPCFIFFLASFVRRSDGFSVFFGISHIFPMRETPGMRFSPHSFWTLRSETPHFFAASGQDIYSIPQSTPF